MVGSADTETTAGKGPPEGTFVGTTVPVHISLNPSITSGGEGGVARLKGESIDEETEVDNVSFTGVGVGACGGREAVGLNEGGVDVVEDIGPGKRNGRVRFTHGIREG